MKIIHAIVLTITTLFFFSFTEINTNEGLGNKNFIFLTFYNKNNKTFQASIPLSAKGRVTDFDLYYWKPSSPVIIYSENSKDKGYQKAIANLAEIIKKNGQVQAQSFGTERGCGYCLSSENILGIYFEKPMSATSIDIYITSFIAKYKEAGIKIYN